MYDYGYAELAAAIVKQAVDDWRYICQTGTDISSDTKRHPLQYASTYASFGALQAFFQSDWFELLCGDNARNRIVEALNAERAKAIRRKGPGTVRKGRKTPLYEHNGQSLPLSQWASIAGIKPATLWGRVYRGLTLEEALAHKHGAPIKYRQS